MTENSLISRFTENQLKCLFLLSDGNWHDRSEIKTLLKLKLIPPNIYNRIIKPLEDAGVVEQEERPTKEGSKKIKKLIRIKKDPDLLFLMDERDYYQDLYQQAKTRQAGEKEALYKRAYEIFDRICRSHDEHGGLSVSFAPAQSELYKIAAKIEKYCKTPEQAIVVACIARPDLYREYRAWQTNYARGYSTLIK